MTQINKLVTMLGLAAVLGLSGCNCGRSDDAPKNKSYAKEYGFLTPQLKAPSFSDKDTITDVLPDTIIGIEGRITHVKPS
ncbi:MAG: hypothetical protein ACP5N1_05860, partial [Candidatus Woesearchaeota archaeon]